MRRRLFFASILGVTGLLLAAEWTAYLPIGESVSVSYAKVDSTTYTWSFRNDGSTTITDMTFSYSYFDADSNQYKTNKDVLPLSIKPGDKMGGWAAFTANTRTQPTIRILEIKRK